MVNYRLNQPSPLPVHYQGQIFISSMQHSWLIAIQQRLWQSCPDKLIRFRTQPGNCEGFRERSRRSVSQKIGVPYIVIYGKDDTKGRTFPSKESGSGSRGGGGGELWLDGAII